VDGKYTSVFAPSYLIPFSLPLVMPSTEGEKYYNAQDVVIKHVKSHSHWVNLTIKGNSLHSAIQNANPPSMCKATASRLPVPHASAAARLHNDVRAMPAGKRASHRTPILDYVSARKLLYWLQLEASRRKCSRANKCNSLVPSWDKSGKCRPATAAMSNHTLGSI